MQSLGAYPAQQGEAAQGRHVEIHNDHIRFLFLQQAHRLIVISRHAGHANCAALFEQLRETLAKQGVIVDQENA